MVRVFTRECAPHIKTDAQFMWCER